MGIVSKMDNRDLARIEQTELLTGMFARTVALPRAGTDHLTLKHLEANFNSRHFCQELRSQFGDCVVFHQIILDYIWSPRGSWGVSHWSDTFFRKTLPELSNHFVSSDKPICHVEGGVIFLPLTFHVIRKLIQFSKFLENHYVVSFVAKDELPYCHSLYSGTMTIHESTMRQVFGK